MKRHDQRVGVLLADAGGRRCGRSARQREGSRASPNIPCLRSSSLSNISLLLLGPRCAGSAPPVSAGFSCRSIAERIIRGERRPARNRRRSAIGRHGALLGSRATRIGRCGGWRWRRASGSWRSMRSRFRVRAKSDASPVTEADEAADALISAGLPRPFPDVPSSPRSRRRATRRRADRFLIVDPLDGTKEFVQRRGDFTVNIAYVEDGVPCAASSMRRRRADVLHPGRWQRGRGDGPFDPTAPAAAPLKVSSPDNGR
jgi:hypothetical protein